MVEPVIKLKDGRDLARYMLQNYSAIKAEIKAVPIIIELRHSKKLKSTNTTLRKLVTLVASEVRYGKLTDDDLLTLADISSKQLKLLDIALKSMGNKRDAQLIRDYYMNGFDSNALEKKYSIVDGTIEARRTSAIKTLGDTFELDFLMDIRGVLEKLRNDEPIDDEDERDLLNG